eukprot:5800232-Heterocapsa_arctica.AAC.1
MTRQVWAPNVSATRPVRSLCASTRRARTLRMACNARGRWRPGHRAGHRDRGARREIRRPVGRDRDPQE